tara:strand:+ start:127 stop:582 length:456 start_codon:yes stop_codon:yes gene_type:complete
MADSRVYSILDAIKGKTAGDFSLKSSGLNMSNRVIIGSVQDPPYVPFGCVHFIDYTTQHGPTLGRYSMVPRYEIYLFVGGSNLAERMRAILNLCSDVIENITADRFLGLGGGTIDDVLCEFTAMDGDKFGLESTGIGYIEVTTPFQSSTGI